MNSILTIIEIAALVILIGINILMIRKKKAEAKRSGIEVFQKRESELDRLLANEAGDREDDGRLRPYEEKYSSESREPVTADGGIRIELKVTTPVSEKKYLTTISNRLKIGTDPANDLILDSQLAAGREAVLVREKKNLFFRRLNMNGEVYVVRNRSRKLLKGDSIRVHSQDRYCIRDVELEIRFV